MNRLDNISGILFDLEGVLFVGEQLIDGAVETVQYLKQKHIPYRFVTNTTTKSRGELAYKMQRLGFAVEADEILTAPCAASAYLQKTNPASCYLLVADAVKEEFSAFSVSEENPDVVVVGDIGPVWNYDIVNRVFQMLMSGAELVALHKSKYWQTVQGLQVDIGAFIAGLEYASGKPSVVIGKPSEAFFSAGIQALGYPKEKILMVGDDIESDIGGAQKSGICGALVRTGKYREDIAVTSSVTPDIILDSVADLKKYF
ncbi:TIGR01458 family HAD-type hydrolase [Vibrio albus]|uniref:Haloacid dehalogenase-like hydrolase domain-containing protein 2 n=1 Tax=Vibrio albus TaxID=2200953 RepID=A0A2U3B992_9VIBR|nr:TIGR01458 family HAD-type hydrolase [Vibrio albus]PWI33315.1 TIGR01458 family HAD-type hydrolase [Vibrio albus]